MNLNRNRILLIVDGSDQSFQTAEYASKVFVPERTEVTLFHVMNKVPDTFWDWEEDPLVPQHIDYMKGWEAQKEEKMREFMTSAQQIFLDAGFPKEAVSWKIQKRESGIARDIISEAHKGYDALVVGRKGLSTLDDQMLGSVATKILGKLTDITVCLVGGKPKTGKFLLGLDTSQGSLRAVNFVAGAVGNCEPTVTLTHVLRTPDQGRMERFDREQVDKYMKEAQEALQPIFEKATRTFVEASANPGKIGSKTITGVPSRAGALLEEARRGDYGTIVVGRRGVSRIEEFQMGRVASKLTQGGRNLAVWIVS
jgi:nucleotide-binding universal stress UspA family protein